MNALPQFQPRQSPPRRQSPRQSQRRQPAPQQQPLRRPVQQTETQRVARQYRIAVIEISLRLGVNVGLSAIALSTLAYLLPYRTAQAQRLKEVQTEVTQAEGRVAQLQAEFSRSFDSSQVKSILQEQTHMVDPSQRVIIFDSRIPLEGEKSDKVAQKP